MKIQHTIVRCGVLLFLSLPAFCGGVSAPSAISLDSEQIKASQNARLNDLVGRSDLIFRGKLTEISEALSIEGIPYTFVTYQVKEVIAGQYSLGSITLKFVGGEFPNGNRLSATNSPQVVLGEESILMAQQRQNTGCDFVDCEHGRFLLDGEQVIAANESAVVVDDKGSVEYISSAARNKALDSNVKAKSTIPRFIAHIKSIDQAASAQRKVARVGFSNTDKRAPFEAYPALTRAKAGPSIPKPISITPSLAPTNNDHNQ